MKGTLYAINPDGSVIETPLASVPALEALQGIVGGYIEPVPGFNRFRGFACAAFCNEEGKLEGLPVNRAATAAWRSAVGTWPGDVLVGSVAIVCGDAELLSEL